MSLLIYFIIFYRKLPDKRAALSWQDRRRKVVAGVAFAPVLDAAAVAVAYIRGTSVVAGAGASSPFGVPSPTAP